MPIYEYHCESCGKDHEIMQKITDEPLSTCPACGGRMKKKISNTSFVLKGSGWYVTDYARKDQGGNGGNGRSNTSKQSADAKPDAKGESKSEAKSETKAESKTESGSSTPKSE